MPFIQDDVLVVLLQSHTRTHACRCITRLTWCRIILCLDCATDSLTVTVCAQFPGTWSLHCVLQSAAGAHTQLAASQPVSHTHQATQSHHHQCGVVVINTSQPHLLQVWVLLNECLVVQHIDVVVGGAAGLLLVCMQYRGHRSWKCIALQYHHVPAACMCPAHMLWTLLLCYYNTTRALPGQLCILPSARLAGDAMFAHAVDTQCIGHVKHRLHRGAVMQTHKSSFASCMSDHVLQSTSRCSWHCCSD